MKKVHITSLGCAKNLVDSEVLGGQLKQRNYTLTKFPEEAELIIINTCGFIKDAKTESIQAIFEALKLKESDKDKQVFVTGCLSQRYKNELASEIPEIDALFGTEDYKHILERLGENRFHAEDLYKFRELSTPKHFTYLKISEGCNHTCAFCAIPKIRGSHRSRKIEDILDEAKTLARQGVKELIIVSQDTSYYGKDLYQKPKIIDLLTRLATEEMFTWIRPLYWYPSNFPIEFIHLMNKFDSIIPYLDMPVQHASNHMFEQMRRAETREKLIKMYEDIRNIRSDIVLRTTFIVGHPGESESDFNLLKDFIEKIRFDRAGTFKYSDEEGTAAYKYIHKVDDQIAERRYSELMEIQRQISIEKNQRLVDTQQLVLIDAYDHQENYYLGRTFRDAPEIDNEIIISDTNFDHDVIGTFRNVMIKDASEYELYGSFDVNLY
jgi:ribosomal protein S12 methylthiotransferase